MVAMGSERMEKKKNFFSSGFVFYSGLMGFRVYKSSFLLFFLIRTGPWTGSYPELTCRNNRWFFLSRRKTTELSFNRWMVYTHWCRTLPCKNIHGSFHFTAALWNFGNQMGRWDGNVCLHIRNMHDVIVKF
jgi:hypothetical protein